MRTSKSNSAMPSYYTIREAAWILGVDTSKVCRAIRQGVLPTVRRRSQLVVPAHALTRLIERGESG